MRLLLFMGISPRYYEICVWRKYVMSIYRPFCPVCHETKNWSALNTIPSDIVGSNCFRIFFQINSYWFFWFLPFMVNSPQFLCLFRRFQWILQRHTSAKLWIFCQTNRCHFVNIRQMNEMWPVFPVRQLTLDSFDTCLHRWVSFCVFVDFCRHNFRLH